MSLSASSISAQPPNSPLAPDLVLRVGFAGKRELDAAQSETVRNRLLDVFSVLGWRLIEISPLDDATNERPVPAIAKFYSHKQPTLRLIHGLCEGADSIASGVRNSSNQKSKIGNPQSSISPVLLHPNTGEVFLIEPGDDLLAVLSHDSRTSTGWQETLATWVTQITADPERSEDATGNASASHGLGLMNEFFHQATAQPGSHPVATAPAHKTTRERLWVTFLNRFKPAQTKTPSGPSAAAFAPWRNRASELSGRYSGLYRGTYFLNHLLAVTAVLLAAWSLVLMGKTSTQLTEWVQGAADVAHIAQAATDSAKKSSDFAPWVFPVLLALAALKLWIVVFIFRSTHAAIHGASSSPIQKSKNPKSLCINGKCHTSPTSPPRQPKTKAPSPASASSSTSSPRAAESCPPRNYRRVFLSFSIAIYADPACRSRTVEAALTLLLFPILLV